jgi:hypothetical protein
MRYITQRYSPGTIVGRVEVDVCQHVAVRVSFYVGFVLRGIWFLGKEKINRLAEQSFRAQYNPYIDSYKKSRHGEET